MKSASYHNHLLPCVNFWENCFYLADANKMQPDSIIWQYVWKEQMKSDLTNKDKGDEWHKEQA